jgi:hypothetical protein
VLPLKHYDVILGFDWLETFSPMKIYYKAKWMSISYEGGIALIQGILSELKEGDMVQLCQVAPQMQMAKDNELVLPQGLPEEVSGLLQSYVDVFTSKVEFPPPRSCSHAIPLIPSARPVNVRPYHYAPALKSEIEKQVQDMLEVGLIQPSSSSFSSLVILVKKKDASYWFCVDYRHLNAITLKGQHSVPIINEFLVELHGASWFSSLDLCAGFHQIPMCEDDYYKTAFQTHHSHYEFKVMSFGLTGAPTYFSERYECYTTTLVEEVCTSIFL